MLFNKRLCFVSLCVVLLLLGLQLFTSTAYEGDSSVVEYK